MGRLVLTCEPTAQLPERKARSWDAALGSLERERRPEGTCCQPGARTETFQWLQAASGREPRRTHRIGPRCPPRLPGRRARVQPPSPVAPGTAGTRPRCARPRVRSAVTGQTAPREPARTRPSRRARKPRPARPRDRSACSGAPCPSRRSAARRDRAQRNGAPRTRATSCSRHRGSARPSPAGRCSRDDSGRRGTRSCRNRHLLRCQHRRPQPAAPCAPRAAAPQSPSLRRRRDRGRWVA